RTLAPTPPATGCWDGSSASRSLSVYGQPNTAPPSLAQLQPHAAHVSCPRKGAYSLAHPHPAGTRQDSRCRIVAAVVVATQPRRARLSAGSPSTAPPLSVRRE